MHWNITHQHTLIQVENIWITRRTSSRRSGGEARCRQQWQQYRPGRGQFGSNLNFHQRHPHLYWHQTIFLIGNTWELFLHTGNVSQPSASRLNLKDFTFTFYQQVISKFLLWLLHKHQRTLTTRRFLSPENTHRLSENTQIFLSLSLLFVVHFQFLPAGWISKFSLLLVFFTCRSIEVSKPFKPPLMWSWNLVSLSKCDLVIMSSCHHFTMSQGWIIMFSFSLIIFFTFVFTFSQ